MNTHLRDRLAAADPAGGLPGYAAAEAARIVDRIVGEHAAYRPSVPGRGARTARRTLAVVGALVGTAAAIVVAQQLAPAGASDPARRALVQAAAQASDPPARPDQWWQVTRTGYGPDGSIVRRVEFVAVDGARPTVIVDESLPPGVTGTGPGTRSVWSTGLAPDAIPGSWQLPNHSFLAGLPRDVDSLRARLYADTAGHGRSVDGEAVVYVADLLRTGLVPADLRRRLYAVLETIPGVDLAAAQAVAGGRTGVVISYTESAINPSAAQRQELLLDPVTGDLLAERTVSGVDPTGWTTIERVVVDAVPADLRSAEVVLACRVVDGGVMCAPGGGGALLPSLAGSTGATATHAVATPPAR